MNSSPRIDKALKRAEELHNGQLRKSGEAFITHPVAVAELVAEYGGDEDTIMAALMHDTVEDVPGYTNAMLEGELGPRVAHIVEGVTQEKWQSRKDLPREEQVALFEEMLARTLHKIESAGPEAVLVAACDKIHNLTSMAEHSVELGEAFTNKFRNIPQKLKHYRRLLDVVRKYYRDNGLPERLEGALVSAERVLLTS